MVSSIKFNSYLNAKLEWIIRDESFGHFGANNLEWVFATVSTCFIDCRVGRSFQWTFGFVVRRWPRLSHCLSTTTATTTNTKTTNAGPSSKNTKIGVSSSSTTSGSKSSPSNSAYRSNALLCRPVSSSFGSISNQTSTTVASAIGSAISTLNTAAASAVASNQSSLTSTASTTTGSSLRTATEAFIIPSPHDILSSSSSSSSSSSTAAAAAAAAAAASLTHTFGRGRRNQILRGRVSSLIVGSSRIPSMVPASSVPESLIENVCALFF